MKLSGRRIFTFIFLGIVLLLFVSLHACMRSFRMSGKQIDQYFAEKKILGKQESYQTGFREIHYIQSGNDTMPLALFIHGSPGSLSAFIEFLADSILLQKALLISTDRPGFGYSNFGNAEPSL